MEHSVEFFFILKPSPHGGVGVFAARDIAEGTILFKPGFSLRTLKIRDIPQPFLKYCIYISEEEALCPERFDRMEIGWYLNHSDHPNVGKNAEKRSVALRDIAMGEEILIDYNTLNEPESMREEYYFKKN